MKTYYLVGWYPKGCKRKIIAQAQMTEKQASKRSKLLHKKKIRFNWSSNP